MSEESCFIEASSEVESTASAAAIDRGKAVAVALVGLAALVAITYGPGFFAWADGFARSMSAMIGLLVVATAGAVARDRSWERRAIAIAILCGLAALLVARLGGYRLRVDPWPDPRFVAFAIAMLGVTITGLVRQRRWARWSAIAIAIAGGGAALFALVSVDAGPYHAWAMSAFALVSVTLGLSIGGATMAVDDREDPDDFSQVWSDRVRVVWWLRSAIVSGLVAVPMLLAYAWLEPAAIAITRPAAIGVAIAIVLAVVAIARGRAIGALVLAAAGLAVLTLLVVGLAHAELAFHRAALLRYAAFFLPLGLAATVSGAALTRAATRL